MVAGKWRILEMGKQDERNGSGVYIPERVHVRVRGTQYEVSSADEGHEGDAPLPVHHITLRLGSSGLEELEVDYGTTEIGIARTYDTFTVEYPDEHTTVEISPERRWRDFWTSMLANNEAKE